MANGGLSEAEIRQRQAQARITLQTQLDPAQPSVEQVERPAPGAGTQTGIKLRAGPGFQPTSSTARTRILSLIEGATFGTIDELDKFLRDQLGIGVDNPLVRDILAAMPQGERLAGNVLGGVAGAPLLGLRAPATVGQAARQGAGLGALAGAGFAEGGPAQRLAGAGLGAAAGASFGAGGQALIGAVGRAIARARQGVTGPTARALDDVLRDLRAGDVTPQQVRARLRNLGQEGILADIPELQRLAQQTAARTGTGQRIAQTALEGRTKAGGERVTEALDIAFQGLPLREVRQGIVAARRAQAQPLYAEALSGGPLQRTQALAGLIGDDAGKGGSNLVRGQLESLRRSNPTFKGVPDTDPNLLHATRVALGERTKGLGATKRNINDVVQQLTDAMDEAGATGYRNAVDTFRSDSLALEAFDAGRKALGGLPEDASAFLARATPGERDTFVAGLGREVLKRLETGETGNAAQGVRSVLRGEKAQILRESLGPEAFTALRRRLLRELEFAKTAGRVLGGSPTQPRQVAGVEQLRRAGRVERAGQALRGAGPVSAVAELATAAGSGAPNVARERALAQLLFRSQGQGLSPERFAARTPLLELAQRQRLLSGASGQLRPFTRAVPGAAGAAGGRGSAALLDLAGF